jgi:hypothetical protein
MVYLFAFLAGIAAAVAGWFVTGAIAAVIAGWYGMSDFEGGRGMFAFLGVGPIGGLICMILAIWLVLRVGHGSVPLGRALAQVVGVLVAIALVVAAGIAIRLGTLDTYTNTLPPTLEFELRMPAAMATVKPSDLSVELHTAKNVGVGSLADHWEPAEDGRMMLSGRVEMAFKTSGRLLVLKMPEQPTRLYRLPFSRDPSSMAGFGEWQPPRFIDAADADQPRDAPADDPVQARYRVRRAGDG